MNRWFHSVLLSFLTIIWVTAFISLSWQIERLDQGLSLAVLGIATVAGLTYSFQYYQTSFQQQNKTKILQTAIQSMGSFGEVIVIDEVGKAIWTSQAHTYPSQDEFVHKLLQTCEPSQELDELISAIRHRKHHSSLLLKGEKWHLVRLFPFDLSGGIKKGIVISLQDLSPYFSDYLRLQESNHNLEQLIDNASFGLFYLSPSQHIVGINKTLTTWLEGTKKQILGEQLHTFCKGLMNDTDSISQQTLTTFNNQFLRVIIYSPEKRFSEPHLVCRLDDFSYYDSQKDVLGQTFLQSAIAAMIINREGTLVAFNKALQRLLSQDMEDLHIKVGFNFFEFVLPSTKSEITTKLHRLYENDHVSPFKIRFKNDKTQTNAYGCRIQDSLILVQLIDTSEQKRLEHQFIQSKKMQVVGQLVGGIAHDFNNLLTAMIGYCDLLLQRYMPNDAVYTDVMQIKQNGTRATNLVRQLLAFSRQQTLQPKVLIITDILAELSILLRRLIGADVELKMIHERGLWSVKVDPGQLERVIINLAVNVRDTIANKVKQPHTLTIRTSNYVAKKQQRIGREMIALGDYVLIEVIDTGYSIASEHLDHLFEPFFSTKEAGSGTGLDLSTIYGIVKQTGGFIFAENNPYSSALGVVFKIFLPRYTNEMPLESAQEDQEPIRDLTGVGNILLVEDEGVVRQFSARVLREKGYKVIEAESGESALELVNKSERFDLVITDVVMPKMDGPTLVKKLRNLNCDVKVIFISGYTEDTFRKNLDQIAGIHFLQKPYALKDLAEKVKGVLDI